MKTRKLLTLTLSMAMLFIAFEASAQTHEPYGDMTDQTTWGYADSVTVNSTLPYYVEPDATINEMSANYDPDMGSSATDQGIYTDFSWTYTGEAGNSIQYYPNASNDTVPYVHVNFTSVTTTGPDELSVTETAPSGGCSGTPVTLDIYVVDEPSFDVTSDGNNVTYERCALTDEPIQVNNIADNGIEGGNLKFQMDYTVENLNSDLTVSATLTGPTTEYPTIPEDGNIGGGPVTVLTRSMPVENGEITRYTYTFDGISDHISRKSDYWDQSFNTAAPGDADFTYYDPNGGAEVSIAYIIYPTPNTGDIHFVPNSFDL